MSEKKTEELKNNISESDAKEHKSFMTEKNRLNFSIHEVNFFENHHIERTTLNSRWEWMNVYLDLILDFTF